jgi:tetratricopeptide (TPR) repeat protein
MFELLALVAISAVFIRSAYAKDDSVDEVPEKIGNKLGKLWEIAHVGMKDNKLLRAEKALLTILRIDEKNAAAYNRLGILYAKQKEFKDAIDCFEIASSIEKSPSSLHNLGLIYYETGDYAKAAIAFEEAIELDEEMASRHIAYAKVQEKLGNDKVMISSLERAAEIEPNKEVYMLLMRAYEINEMEEELKALKRKIARSSVAKTAPKKVSRPKRVVV